MKKIVWSQKPAWYGQLSHGAIKSSFPMTMTTSYSPLCRKWMPCLSKKIRIHTLVGFKSSAYLIVPVNHVGSLGKKSAGHEGPTDRPPPDIGLEDSWAWPNTRRSKARNGTYPRRKWDSEPVATTLFPKFFFFSFFTSQQTPLKHCSITLLLVLPLRSHQ